MTEKRLQVVRHLTLVGHWGLLPFRELDERTDQLVEFVKELIKEEESCQDPQLSLFSLTPPDQL